MILSNTIHFHSKSSYELITAKWACGMMAGTYHKCHMIYIKINGMFRFSVLVVNVCLGPAACVCMCMRCGDNKMYLCSSACSKCSDFFSSITEWNDKYQTTFNICHISKNKLTTPKNINNASIVYLQNTISTIWKFSFHSVLSVAGVAFPLCITLLRKLYTVYIEKQWQQRS